jgi:hypothetical protein
VSGPDLDAELAGPTTNLVFDNAGTRDLRGLLERLPETQFAKDNLEALLTNNGAPEDWRVGEALAERYLTANRNCFFPWPDGRDERKRGSSLPSADLVGFQSSGGRERFAFGEVKTSSHAAYPPSATYGRHGLKQQMEDLRDCREVRDDLVRYLGHRAPNTVWQSRYQAATRAYLNDTGDVRLFGLLVRDVAPHQDDLRVRVNSLANGCPATTVIELTALYLPAGSIATLASRTVASRQTGGGGS